MQDRCAYANSRVVARPLFKNISPLEKPHHAPDVKAVCAVLIKYSCMHFTLAAAFSYCIYRERAASSEKAERKISSVAVRHLNCMNLSSRVHIIHRPTVGLCVCGEREFAACLCVFCSVDMLFELSAQE